jgi:trk system potassium uptake protein TrkA
MFVLVVGGGKVGYYLTKELIESGHEVVLMEKDRARAAQIVDELGSIVVPHDGCEGKYLGEAGSNRADIVAAVTGDDEDNLVICQMAKHHFDVPRTIARVNNPKNEDLFRHLGVDEIISPTRMALGSIEQDIPVHELLHLAELDNDLEIIEAQLQADSPAVGRTPGDLVIPEACSLFAVVRNGVATPIRSDTVLQEGDKVIAIGRADCERLLHEQLIGETQEAETACPEGQGLTRGARPDPRGKAWAAVGRLGHTSVGRVGRSPRGGRPASVALREARTRPVASVFVRSTPRASYPRVGASSRLPAGAQPTIGLLIRHRAAIPQRKGRGSRPTTGAGVIALPE